MKDVVRLSIKAFKINEYIDTFKALVKYDDHYILENVCTDIYQKCVQSIRDKCSRDNLKFSVYIEKICDNDDLAIQNIVVKRLRAELEAELEAVIQEVVIQEAAGSDNKVQRLDAPVSEVNSLKRKLEKLESKDTKKRFLMTELRELVAHTSGEVVETEQSASDAEGYGRMGSSGCPM